MKKIFLLGTVFLSNIAIAAPPFNVYFDSVSPIMEDNDTIIFDGMRVDGFGFSADNDALRLEYNFDYNSLNYILNTDNVTVYSNIGVFHGGQMAIDVDLPQPEYTVNGKAYQFGEIYSFESTLNEPFIAEMNLQAGHVITTRSFNQSNDYSRQLMGLNLDSTFLGKASEGIRNGPQKIFKDGLYHLKMIPRNASDLKFNLMIFNDNNRKLKELTNNDSISVSFKSQTNDYAKYKIVLGAGDTLNLSKSSTNIRMKLVNSKGKQVVFVWGVSLVYQSENAEEYYLFIYNRNNSGGSYSGSVFIEPDVTL
jgi:hypothetical protein